MNRSPGHRGQQRFKTLRRNMRTATMVRSEDERDMGVRSGVAEAFGFGDPRSFGEDVEAAAPTYFAWLK